VQSRSRGQERQSLLRCLATASPRQPSPGYTPHAAANQPIDQPLDQLANQSVDELLRVAQWLSG